MSDTPGKIDDQRGTRPEEATATVDPESGEPATTRSGSLSSGNEDVNLFGGFSVGAEVEDVTPDGGTVAPGPPA